MLGWEQLHDRYYTTPLVPDLVYLDDALVAKNHRRPIHKISASVSFEPGWRLQFA